MLDPATRDVDAVLKALPGIAGYLHANAIPPSQVKPDGTVVNAKSPVGFSAALLPYLSALNEKNLENQQMSRVQSEFDSKRGLYGNPAKYYDQNLVLFALGWKLRQSWFDPQGALEMSWKNSRLLKNDLEKLGCSTSYTEGESSNWTDCVGGHQVPTAE